MKMNDRDVEHVGNAVEAGRAAVAAFGRLIEAVTAPVNHGTPMRVERECSFGDLRFNYHTLEGTPTAPVIKASMPVDSDDLINKLVGLSCSREARSLTVPSLMPMNAVLAGITSRIALDNTVNVTIYFRDCGASPASTDGPTMRAECSASDVTASEQDRTASPPSAECGPSPRIDAYGTPGRREMAAMGWVIRDEPHE